MVISRHALDVIDGLSVLVPASLDHAEQDAERYIERENPSCKLVKS